MLWSIALRGPHGSGTLLFRTHGQSTIPTRRGDVLAESNEIGTEAGIPWRAPHHRREKGGVCACRWRES